MGDKPQNVCWKVSVVFTSRITFSFNLVPLYTTVSKNIVSVNFGGEFNSRMMYASSKKVTMSGLKTV